VDYVREMERLAMPSNTLPAQVLDEEDLAQRHLRRGA
jgi:hypothetical protein